MTSAGLPDGTTDRGAVWRGLLVAFSMPGLVLFATALGFGALARDLGLTGSQASFLSVSLYAMPAQVLLIDQLARGVGLAAAALAVSFTAIRLLPMTVALMPLLRTGRRANPLLLLLAVHFIAVTAWLEGNRRLPETQPELRLHYFVGIGTGMALSTLLGTIVGYWLATGLPPTLAATLLMMTPAYFALSLLYAAREAADWLAIGTGFVLGPLLFWLLPGPDLLITGLVGGTVAYLFQRRSK